MELNRGNSSNRKARAILLPQELFVCVPLPLQSRGISIISPTEGAYIDESKSITISWTTDRNYISFSVIGEIGGDEFTIAEKLPPSVRSYTFYLRGMEGEITLKVLGYLRDKDSEIAISDNTKIVIYRHSDGERLLTLEKEKAKNPVFFRQSKIGYIDYANDKVILYNRNTGESEEYLSEKVFKDRISGIELDVQQQYHPTSVAETSGITMLISEQTDNRFTSLITDRDGRFVTKKIFNCGHIGISAGKIFVNTESEEKKDKDDPTKIELTDSQKRFCLWEEEKDKKYVINQTYAVGLSGIGTDAEIFHNDVKDIELRLPFSVQSEEFTKKLIVEVVHNDGTPVEDVTITGLKGGEGKTNAEGVYEQEFTCLPSEEAKYTITPSKKAYSFYPVSAEADFSKSNEITLMFIATRLYSVSGRLLNQRNEELEQSVDVIAVEAYTERLQRFSGTGRYNTGETLAGGLYFVYPYREGINFSPRYQLVEVREDLSGIDFWTNTWSISGKAYDSNGSGIEDVMISIDGLSSMTDTSGEYKNKNVLPGKYEITATKESETVDEEKLLKGDLLGAVKKVKLYFTPEKREVTLTDKDIIGQDFFQLPTYEISGKFVNLPATRKPKEEFSYAVLTDVKRMFGDEPELIEVRINGTEYKSEGKYLLSLERTSGLGFKIEGLLEGNYTIAPLKTAEYKFVDPQTGAEQWVPLGDSPAHWNLGWVFDEDRFDYYVNTDYLQQKYYAYSGSVQGVVRSGSVGLSGLSLEVVGGEYEYKAVLEDDDVRWYEVPKIVETDAEGKYYLEYQIPSVYKVYPDLNVGENFYSYVPDREAGRKGVITTDNLDISGLDFDATLYPKYTVSGKIEDSNSAAISGIDIVATGGEKPKRKIGQQDTLASYIEFSGVSDEMGNYSIYIHYPGNYVIKPYRTIWSFEPEQKGCEVLANISGIDFVGVTKDENKPIPIPEGYSITGKVIDIFGNTVSGIEIGIGLKNHETKTGSDGEYKITGIPVGDYTVKPTILDNPEESREGYTFSPSSPVAVQFRNKNISGIDFVAIPKYSVEGRVVDLGGNPVEGISVLINQHHSRVIEVSGTDIVWEYDKDLFMPVRVCWEYGNRISITNRGKHNVVSFDRSNESEVARFGSDEPCNAIPGQRSGLDLLSYPEYGRYRNDGAFVITDTGNSRFLIVKEGQKKEQFIQNLEYTVAPMQIMETNDLSIDLLGFFSEKKDVDVMDRAGGFVVDKTFDDVVSGIDIMTFSEAFYDRAETFVNAYLRRVIEKDRDNIVLNQKNGLKMISEAEIVEYRGG